MKSSTATATTGTAERPRGRFAPTPSGPLHLGSLLAATGSYLDARTAGGDWLLRIDDLDAPRNAPGMTDRILRTLEAFGFEWSGNVEFQKDRIDCYSAALSRLESAGHTYRCRCTRTQLAAASVEPGLEPVYPGTCRSAADIGPGPHAIRFRIRAEEPVVRFSDAWQGPVEQDCRSKAGDFLIRRRDGIFAYHLAVVVDDELQGINRIVRGADLLASTPRQILLQRALGYRTPGYAHLPLLLEPDGRKLAKSRRALPLDPSRAAELLCEVLTWLRQEPPAGLARAPHREVWAWALAHWEPSRFAGCRELQLPAT